MTSDICLTITDDLNNSLFRFVWKTGPNLYDLAKFGADFRCFCRISPRFRPPLDMARTISYFRIVTYRIKFDSPWGILTDIVGQNRAFETSNAV